MADRTFHTAQLLNLLDKIKEGDGSAQDDLIRHVSTRLEHLTRQMLSRFPTVKRWSDTNDVLQDALMRLMRSLRQVNPTNTRDFFALASLQVRRQLIDLARHFYGPHGMGANQAAAPQDSSALPLDPPDSSHEPSQLAQWREVHERIDTLQGEEREVVDLLFYQGLTQAEAATILNVTVRTVQRRWHSALLKLHDLLKDLWPDS